MTTGVTSVSETTELADIANLLETKRIKRVPVVRDGKLVDRLVGYPGGAAPIKAWIEKNVGAAGSTGVAEKAATN